MNRLIIIGNGFDLAHGLKTSYNDFILWYIEKCVPTLRDLTNTSNRYNSIIKSCRYFCLEEKQLRLRLCFRITLSKSKHFLFY